MRWNSLPCKSRSLTQSKTIFQRHWHQLSLILIRLRKTGFVLFVIAEGENACSENNLCINGATCVVDDTTYSCLCSNGFTGIKCESKLLNVITLLSKKIMLQWTWVNPEIALNELWAPFCEQLQGDDPINNPAVEWLNG